MLQKLIIWVIMGIFFVSQGEEKIDPAGLMDSCLKKMKEINEKYKYIEKLPPQQAVKELEKKELEIRKYLESLGREKVFLLAIEASKKDAEAPGWILYYGGFSNMKTNPRIFLEYYLYHTKYKDIEPDDYREYQAKGLERYIKEDMGYNQEKGIINEALKFLDEPGNSNENKKIIIQFFWDIWSGFFPRVEKMENRKEIYEEMNQQVIQIGEKLKNYLKDLELSSKSLEILNKFETHYSRQDLPQDFKDTPSYSKVLSILKK